MESSTASDRRLIYRPFLERLNPSSPGMLAALNLIVSPEHDPRDPDEPPIHVAFANAAELNRGSQMALVGGIGSGKTTELWLTMKLLRRHADAINVFVDLAELTDLNELNPGALLIAVGLQLYLKVKKAQRTDDVKAAYQKLKNLATGGTSWVEADESQNDDYEPDQDDAPPMTPIHTPPLLKPRFPAIHRQVADIQAILWEIIPSFIEVDAQITVIIDGLDRLIGTDRFREFAEQDLRALRDFPITVIVAVPLSLWFDKSRFLQDYFDEMRHIPAAIADPSESTFLRDILLRRGAEEVMDGAEVDEIARSSGGVLRDLITLARASAQTAYREDKDRITPDHVQSAVRQLGKRYLVGLGRTHRIRIQRLLKNEEFSLDTPVSIELLINRQVLEHFSQGRDIFAVHPALIRVLEETA
jgi:Cdc6-like AAA superfamily ATPase